MSKYKSNGSIVNTAASSLSSSAPNKVSSSSSQLVNVSHHPTGSYTQISDRLVISVAYQAMTSNSNTIVSVSQSHSSTSFQTTASSHVDKFNTDTDGNGIVLDTTLLNAKFRGSNISTTLI